jgi:tripartite-type tricarboxylate transporter receptor subunit TctC
MTSKRWFSLLAFGMMLGVVAGAPAQDFPARALRLIVPFPPGGPTDQVSRLIAQKVGESTGQAIVVENRPGGGAQIAASALMQSPADGYTLLIGDIGALAVNPTLYQKLSYDPQRDFQAVSLVMSSPMVVLVPLSSPAGSIAQLLDAAKRKQGGLTYASQGIGTGGHLLGEMFKAETGAPIVHVPYKGSAPAMQDLIAGQVDLFFDVMGAALPQHRGGKVKILAVADGERASRAPDIPTMKEAGYPGVDMTVWFGMVTNTGVPQPVVASLNRLIVAALTSPDVSKRLYDQGFDARPSTVADFDSLMRSERQKWGAVVKSSGARVD